MQDTFLNHLSVGNLRSRRQAIAMRFRTMFCQCNCFVCQKKTSEMLSASPKSNPVLSYSSACMDAHNQFNILQRFKLKNSGKLPSFSGVINVRSARLSPARNWLRWRKTTIKPLSSLRSKRKNESWHSYLLGNKAVTQKRRAWSWIFTRVCKWV